MKWVNKTTASHVRAHPSLSQGREKGGWRATAEKYNVRRAFCVSKAINCVQKEEFRVHCPLTPRPSQKRCRGARYSLTECFPPPFCPKTIIKTRTRHTGNDESPRDSEISIYHFPPSATPLTISVTSGQREKQKYFEPRRLCLLAPEIRKEGTSAPLGNGDRGGAGETTTR